MSNIFSEGARPDSVGPMDDHNSEQHQKPTDTQELLHSRKPKTFHEWQAIRRQMGSAYFEPRVQRQLAKDAIELGSAFYDEAKRKKEPWE